MSANDLENILFLDEKISYHIELMRNFAKAALHDMPCNLNNDDAFYHMSRIINYCKRVDDLRKDYNEDMIEIEGAVNHGEDDSKAYLFKVGGR